MERGEASGVRTEGWRCSTVPWWFSCSSLHLPSSHSLNKRANSTLSAMSRAGEMKLIKGARASPRQ